MKARANQLKSMGFTFSFKYSSYIKEDFNVGLVELQTLDDKEWSDLITKIEQEVSRRKAR